jgi:Bifunctional DNA primase/polymerase, N-terminal
VAGFPCLPGRKAPDTANGFKDATTDPEVIRAWWAARPDRNVAIVTGAPGPDVLDIDTGPAGSGWAAFGRLKRAGLQAGASALVLTRSGGLHVYFAGTGQACGRMPRHFLDFKAKGGYVLAPPSFVKADGKPPGTYKLIEHRDGTGRLDWQAARRLLDPPPPLPRKAARNGNITALVEWVAARQEGDRNHPLYWAAKQAAVAGSLDSEAAERLVDAALRAGLAGGEREARRTIASAARKAAAQ